MALAVLKRTHSRMAEESRPSLLNHLLAEEGKGPGSITLSFLPLASIERLAATWGTLHRNRNRERESLLASRLAFATSCSFHELRHYQQILRAKKMDDVIKHCTHLTSIDLSDSDVTDDGLAALAERCPDLESINLCFCRDVKGRGVLALAEHCPRLRSLGLMYFRPSGELVRALVDLRPNLASLNLANTDINDNELSLLARYRDSLTLIDLSCCPNIHDLGLRILADSCPNLTKIDLTDGEVSGIGVEYLCRHLRNLASVIIAKCVFRVGELESLKRTYRRIAFLGVPR